MTDFSHIRIKFKKKCKISRVHIGVFDKNTVAVKRFLKDEDYYLECICEVCRMFCQEESNLTSDEKNQIKDYLDTAYNDIVHWYPQSEKSKETYELIEEALDMEYVIRMVTEKPLTFGGFKRSEVK